MSNKPHTCSHCQRLVVDFDASLLQKLDPLRKVVKKWQDHHFYTLTPYWYDWYLDFRSESLRANSMVGALRRTFSKKNQPLKANRYGTKPLPNLKAAMEQLNERMDLVYFSLSKAQLKLAVKEGCALLIRLTEAVLAKWQIGLLDINQSDFLLAANFKRSSEILSIGVPYYGLNAMGAMHVDPLYQTRCFAPKENSSASEVSRRPINRTPGSESSLDMNRHWYLHCLHNHKSCESDAEVQFILTRVLEIMDDDGQKPIQLRLISPSKPLKYTAISYRWGHKQEFMLRSDNISYLMGGFDLSELPASLQDATKVAIALQFRFLWIDALCIIQEDDRAPGKDKILELRRMGNIYSNASITISASRADSVDEGFLQDRTAETGAPLYALPFRRRMDTLGSIILTPSAQPDPVEPLDRRGWAFQERMLSRRVLDFGSLQTRWACQRIERVDGWSLRSDFLGANNSFRTQFFRNSLLSEGYKLPRSLSPEQKVIQSLDEWHFSLKCYTLRDLTFPTDRLPAIAGVAESYSTYLGDRYIAGLWESKLSLGLLWRSTTETLRGRADPYLAPSWSWASLQGPIEYPCHSFNDDEDWIYFVPPPDPKLKVIDCKVKTKDPEFQFGEISPEFTGFLRLQACTRTAYWMPGDDTSTEQRSKLRNTENNEEIPVLFAVDYLPDDSEFENEGQAKRMLVYLLLLTERSDDNYWGIVVKSRREGDYVRIGRFHMYWHYAVQHDDGRDNLRQHDEDGLWLAAGEQREYTIF